uniref:E3 ubiquitin-protein ligase rnf168-like n=1 Tax=Pristiophorus japonicus TaxID=55135 RepID=UPI00398EFC19
MGRKKRNGLAQPEAPSPELSLTECLCPICQELLAEPVTPPCGHSLCRACFQQTVAISNLNCPLCRRRLSNWARAQTRAGSLVNTELAERIRQQFPQHRNQEPREAEVDRLCPPPQLCKPGEVRQEYEEQIRKLNAELAAREEEELRASEKFIQQLLAEEQEQKIYVEQQRKEMDEQLKRDEKLAQMLSEEMNPISTTLPESVGCRTRLISSKSNSSLVTKRVKLTSRNPSHVGDIQRYLSPTSQKNRVAETSRPRNNASVTENADADDIISSSCSIVSICSFDCEDDEEQEPVSSSTQSALAQCFKGTPTAAITGHQQIDKCTDEQSSEDHDNEMVRVCGGVWKGRERCKEEVALAELEVNFINSNGEDDLLNSAIVPILNHKLDDYAYTSASHCDLDGVDSATVHCDEGIALKPKPTQDQGTKHQIVNQAPIPLKTAVKRKTWNSSGDEETCFAVKKRKVSPNVHNELTESTPLSNGISHEEQLSDWEKNQSEKHRMEEQDRLLALQLQKQLDQETRAVNRQRGSPDEYLLRTNRSTPTKCEKRVLAKKQNPLARPRGRQTSRKLQKSKSSTSRLCNGQTTLTDSSPTKSQRKDRIWQHPASQRKSQRPLCQRPVNCMDAHSAALVNELRNSKKTADYS